MKKKIFFYPCYSVPKDKNIVNTILMQLIKPEHKYC
jgi:hypothetical protein